MMTEMEDRQQNYSKDSSETDIVWSVNDKYHESINEKCLYVSTKKAICLGIEVDTS